MQKFTIFLAIGMVLNVLGIALFMNEYTAAAYVLVVAGIVSVFTGVIVHAKSKQAQP